MKIKKWVGSRKEVSLSQNNTAENNEVMDPCGRILFSYSFVYKLFHIKGEKVSSVYFRRVYEDETIIVPASKGKETFKRDRLAHLYNGGLHIAVYGNGLPASKPTPAMGVIILEMITDEVLGPFTPFRETEICWQESQIVKFLSGYQEKFFSSSNVGPTSHVGLFFRTEGGFVGIRIGNCLEPYVDVCSFHADCLWQARLGDCWVSLVKN